MAFSDRSRNPPKLQKIGFSLVFQSNLFLKGLQLLHIPVTAFSQTDLFLVWIYLEFRSPQELQ